MKRVAHHASKLLSRSCSIAARIHANTAFINAKPSAQYTWQRASTVFSIDTQRRSMNAKSSETVTTQADANSDPFVKLARHPPSVHRAIDTIAEILSVDTHPQPDLWRDFSSWPSSSFQQQSRIAVYNRTRPASIDDIPEYINVAINVILRARIDERGVQRQGFRTLVLVPTREHAIIAERQFNNMLTAIKAQTELMRSKGVDEHNLYELDGIEVLTTIGGHSYEREVNTMDFQEPEIVIATPGRLTKHLKNSDYFRNLKLFVLGECDMLFDPITNASSRSFKKNRFKAQLTDICGHLNPDRMTVCISNGKVLKQEDVPLSLLLSSSESAEEKSDDAEAETEAEAPATDSDRLHIVDSDPNYEKRPAKRAVIACSDDAAMVDSLATFLKSNLHRKVTVFTQSATFSRRITEEMKQREVFCSHLDHKIAQTIREATMHSFNESKNGVIVCTESFAGVLKPDVDVIVHTQLSEDTKVTMNNVEYRERCGDGKENPLSLLIVSGENPLPQDFTTEHSA